MEHGSGGGVGKGQSPECETTAHASVNKHMLHLCTWTRVEKDGEGGASVHRLKTGRGDASTLTLPPGNLPSRQHQEMQFL